MAADYLAVSGISKRYQRGSHSIVALDSIHLRLAPQQSVGVVGESGSGKSTLLRLALGLETPTSGKIALFGKPVDAMSGRSRRALRRRIGVVFQEPREQLDPRWTVRRILGEPARVHDKKRVGDAMLGRWLERVNLRPDVLDRRPDTLSGGQAQRVAIARALALEPSLLLLDEPTASLDMTTRAQVLELFAELRADLGWALLFISHDLDSVRTMTDRVVVVYQGRIMETGPTCAVLRTPQHPYTRALLAAELSIDGQARAGSENSARISPDSDTVPHTGCPFAPRCPVVMDACRAGRIPLRRSGDIEAACLRV